MIYHHCYSLMIVNVIWDQIYLISLQNTSSQYILIRILILKVNSHLITFLYLSMLFIYQPFMKRWLVLTLPRDQYLMVSSLLFSAFVLSWPLHIIFNKSLASGIFPDFRKVSHLTPIFKSGNRADISNYI